MCRVLSNIPGLYASEENGITDICVQNRIKECDLSEADRIFYQSYKTSEQMLIPILHRYSMPTEIYLAILKRHKRGYNNPSTIHKHIRHYLTHMMIPIQLFYMTYDFWEQLYSVMDPKDAAQCIGLAREHHKRSLATTKRTDINMRFYGYDPKNLSVDMNDDIVALALYYRLIPMNTRDIMADVPMWVQAEATYRRLIA